jgi:hypothetical protein
MTLLQQALAFSSRSPEAILDPMAGRVTSASFIGRQEEVERLHRALLSAVAGEPATVLIAGEAGIGKTRLVEHFACQVARQAQVLLGRCLQLSGGGLPYGPIVDALRDLTQSLDPSELDELVGPTSEDLIRLRTLIRMRPLVQVQPGPPHRHLPARTFIRDLCDRDRCP